MSRSVDLFISTDASVEELAAVIAARAGLVPDPSVGPPADDGGVSLVDGDLSARLHEHAFVDDRELVLSRYRYALSLRTTVGGHLGSSPETALLRRVASSLDDHSVLLVLDLQYRSGADDALDDDALEGDAPDGDADTFDTDTFDTDTDDDALDTDADDDALDTDADAGALDTGALDTVADAGALGTGALDAGALDTEDEI